MRFETAPGEQAQVDWGSLWRGREATPRLGVRDDGQGGRHVNAFEYLGGVPRRCLYDAKVITLGRDEEKRPVWNRRMLDFALRVGFEARLCQPVPGLQVESGVKYVRRNMWPSLPTTPT